MEFITDPGTGCYTGDPETRNKFRSTAMHNTVRVDGCEINEIDPNSLFMLQNNDRPEVLQWQSSPEIDTLTAIHHGYQRLSDPVKHQRTVTLDKQTEQLKVVDRMTCRKKHSYEWHLPLYPDVEKISVENNTVLLKRGMVTLKIMFEWENARPIIIDSLYSPGYGIMEPSKMIYLVENETDQKEFIWSISPVNS